LEIGARECSRVHADTSPASRPGRSRSESRSWLAVYGSSVAVSSSRPSGRFVANVRSQISGSSPQDPSSRESAATRIPVDVCDTTVWDFSAVPHAARRPRNDSMPSGAVLRRIDARQITSQPAHVPLRDDPCVVVERRVAPLEEHADAEQGRDDDSVGNSQSRRRATRPPRSPA
jgi:hypothetical protein